MANERLWIALVTFERRDDEQDILPKWAHGACGWMAALAPNDETARQLLKHDIESHGLTVVEIDHEREVVDEEEIDEIDDHLGKNFRAIEPGAQTVWGTIYGYKGDGET
jgi:predicted small metal-binding protein